MGVSRGKAEIGETVQQALVREIKEELDVTVNVGKLIDSIEFDYSTFHLSMDCFLCVIADGEITLKETEEAKWFNKNELYSVDWLPADRMVVDKIADKIM